MKSKELRITLNEERQELSAIVEKKSFRTDKAFLSNCILIAYTNQTLFTYYECNNDLICLFRGKNIIDVKKALIKA